MTTSHRKLALASLATVAALGMTAFLAAAPSIATRTWDGGGADDRWSTAANWVGDVAPVDGDSVIVSTDGNNPSFYDLAPAIRLASVTLVNGAAPEDLSIVGGDPVRLANGGVLINDRAGAGNTTSITVGVNISGGATITASAGTSSLALNNISGTGPLTLVDNTASGAIRVGGTGTYSGGAQINGTGTVIIESQGALFGAVTVDGVVRFATDTTISALAGSGTVEANGSLTFGDAQTSTTFSGVYRDGASAAGLTKQGAGTFTMTGANSYTGPTNVQSGTIGAGAANTFSPSSAYSINAPGVLALNSLNQTIGSLAGAGSVTLGTATLTAGGNNSSTTLSGVISGPGGLAKLGAGTLTLASANTYTGATTVSAGTLRAGGVNVFGSNSAVSVAGGTTLNLNNFDQAIGSLAGAGNVTLGTATLTAGGNNSSTTYSGVLSGNRLTKTGTGTLTLSGANTHTETVVQNGRVNFNGNQPTSGVLLSSGIAGGTGTIGELAATGGTVAPGLSPGLLTMAAMTLSSGTTFSVELNGTTAGTQYDQARVTTGVVDLSGATLSGTLGFAPAAGTIFTIIDKQSAGAVTGTFNGLPQGAFVTIGGAQFAVSYTGGNGNDVTLTAAGTPLVAPATLPPMTVGEPFSTTITASGGVAPYTFAVTAGALPAGLTLTASTGVIAGTPTTAGPYSVTITATDSLGVTQSQAYSGTVAPAPVPSLPLVGLVILALLLGGIGYARLRGGVA